MSEPRYGDACWVLTERHPSRQPKGLMMPQSRATLGVLCWIWLAHLTGHRS